MMRIDANAALALAALIRSDLQAITRIESHVSQFDLNNLSPAELDSLGYSMHNIYNALENCFTQISLFRHAYDFKLDKAKTMALWSRWSLENASVKQALTLFTNQLEQQGNQP
jgi:hypothetical protein